MGRIYAMHAMPPNNVLGNSSELVFNFFVTFSTECDLKPSSLLRLGMSSKQTNSARDFLKEIRLAGCMQDAIQNTVQ